MKIEVTQEHIKRGQQDNCMWCPIALAIAPFNKLNLAVGSTSLFYGPPCLQHSQRFAILPKVCWEFIAYFDVGSSEAQPFTFNLSAECFMK